MTKRHKDQLNCFFLIKISAFILKIAIIKPTKIKATVITKRGWSIELSIEGEESLLTLAG